MLAMFGNGTFYVVCLWFLLFAAGGVYVLGAAWDGLDDVSFTKRRSTEENSPRLGLVWLHWCSQTSETN